MKSQQVSGTWPVEPATAEQAPEILELTREGMLYYAEQSGLSPETAHLQLGALRETLDSVLRDIEHSYVFVVRLDKKIIASLRLKPMPAGEAKDCFLLTRFTVKRELRAGGLGAELLCHAFRFAKRHNKEGIYLYTSSENASLLKFYSSLGFAIQSISSERGYPRALLFAPC